MFVHVKDIPIIVFNLMKFFMYKVKYLHDIFSVVTSAGRPASLEKLEKQGIFKK